MLDTLLEGTSLDIEKKQEGLDEKYSGEHQEIWNGWASFIDKYPWNTFWTITWREIWSIRAIIKAIRRYFDRVTTYEAFAPSYIFFVEPHKSGLPHVHGLTRHERFSRKRMWEDLYDKFGRSSGHGYREDINGQYYIAKYCSKNRTEVILDERKR